MTPILALRRAILARIAGDAALAAVAREAAIHDEPSAAEGVRATFGRAALLSDVEGLAVQEIEVVATARGAAASAALQAADRIGALLDGADLALEGHALVSLRVVSLRAARDERTAVATLTLRAATEAR